VSVGSSTAVNIVASLGSNDYSRVLAVVSSGTIRMGGTLADPSLGIAFASGSIITGSMITLPTLPKDRVGLWMHCGNASTTAIDKVKIMGWKDRQ
jgi:hypothetical protein